MSETSSLFSLIRNLLSCRIAFLTTMTGPPTNFLSSSTSNPNSYNDMDFPLVFKMSYAMSLANRAGLYFFHLESAYTPSAILTNLGLVPISERTVSCGVFPLNAHLLRINLVIESAHRGLWWVTLTLPYCPPFARLHYYKSIRLNFCPARSPTGFILTSAHRNPSANS